MPWLEATLQVGSYTNDTSGEYEVSIPLLKI